MSQPRRRLRSTTVSGSYWPSSFYARVRAVAGAGPGTAAGVGAWLGFAAG